MLHLRRMLSPSLFALIAVALAMPGCDSGDVVDPGASTALRIESSPDEVSGGWQLATPGSMRLVGRGDTLLTALEPGEYWLLFEPEPGWNSPAENPVQIALAAGATELVAATWSPVTGEPGTIRIDAGGRENVLWNLRGPDAFFAAGTGSRVLPGRAPGEYSILWEQSAGETASSRESAVLAPGAELVMRAQQTSVPGGGTIEIDPNPDQIDAPWRLSIPGGDAISARGDTVLTGMPTGTYSLRWGDCGGFFTPDPVVAVLDPYSSLRLATTYVTPLHPVGTIEIGVSPAGLEAPWQLSSGGEFTASGLGDSTLTFVPAGPYSITWGEVSGYLTPSPAQARLDIGGVLHLTGNYGLGGGLVGDIHIDPSPESIQAPWRLVTGAGLVIEGVGDSTLTDQPAGIYTLYWGAVDGFVTPTPNPVTRKLDPDGVLGFSIQ